MKILTHPDFVAFAEANADRVFELQVYRRLFTPYEQERRFLDDTEFTERPVSVKLKEAIPLGHGDYLVGVSEWFEDDPEWNARAPVTFYRLSEIRLSYAPSADEFTEDPESC